MGYGEAKKLLVEKIESHFRTARERRQKLVQNTDYVEDVFAHGVPSERGRRPRRRWSSCGMLLVSNASHEVSRDAKSADRFGQAILDHAQTACCYAQSVHFPSRNLNMLIALHATVMVFCWLGKITVVYEDNPCNPFFSR